MRVVQLIGPYAGKVLEMPYHVGMNCIAVGTACLPGDAHNHRVRGLSLDQFDEEALTGKDPEVAEELVTKKAKTKKAKTKKAKTKKAKTEEPVAEKPVAEKPVAEKPR